MVPYDYASINKAIEQAGDGLCRLNCAVVAPNSIWSSFVHLIIYHFHTQVMVVLTPSHFEYWLHTVFIVRVSSSEGNLSFKSPPTDLSQTIFK